MIFASIHFFGKLFGLSKPWLLALYFSPFVLALPVTLFWNGALADSYLQARPLQAIALFVILSIPSLVLVPLFVVKREYGSVWPKSFSKLQEESKGFKFEKEQELKLVVAMGFSQFATLAIAALGAMQPVLSFMFRFSGSPYGSFSYMEHSFFVNAATIAYAVAMSVSLYAAVLIKQK